MTPQERAEAFRHDSGEGDLVADIAAAISTAIAERDAGEAERVAAAVAAERARWSRYTRHPMGCARDGGRPCDCGLDALRATSPAPEPHSAGRAATDAAKAARARGEDVYADGEGRCEPAPDSVAAERAVIDAAVALCAHPYGQGCRWAEAYDGLDRAIDALAAARKGGAT